VSGLGFRIANFELRIGRADGEEQLAVKERTAISPRSSRKSDPGCANNTEPKIEFFLGLTLVVKVSRGYAPQSLS